MCGRFTLSLQKSEIMELLNINNWDSDFEWEPSYNIAPTQRIPVLTYPGNILGIHWGLVPRWSKSKNIGSRMINARLETLKEKSSYRNLIQKKRCIIIADGYFEWMSTSAGKQPYYIRCSDHQILYFAGLWEQWFSENNEPYTSCTIITKEAANNIESIHSRMPVILPIEKVEQWIDYKFSIINHQQFLSKLKENLDFHKISTFVNNPINNTPECIFPIKEE